MFSKIMDIIEDPQILACVLIDEIESLAHARDKCLSGEWGNQENLLDNLIFLFF